MKTPVFSILTVILAAATFATAGCATTRAKKPDAATDLSARVQELEGEVQAKDQQIQDLQYQLDSYQQSLDGTTNFNTKSSKSSNIRVAGVTVKDVQKALERAGFDPGPVDGRMGKKTKAAIKAFQRRHNLSADGVVGEKTWAQLRAS